MKMIKIEKTTPIYILAILILSYPLAGLMLKALNAFLNVEWGFESPLFWVWDKIVILGDVFSAILIGVIYFKNIILRVIVSVFLSTVFLFIQTWCFQDGFFLMSACVVLVVWLWCVKYYFPKRDR